MCLKVLCKYSLGKIPQLSNKSSRNTSKEVQGKCKWKSQSNISHDLNHGIFNFYWKHTRATNIFLL